jgi:hypothetical protein
MTQNSAPPPDYAESCDWCGVNPVTRIFTDGKEAQAEGQDGKEEPPVVLKFWQIMGKSFPLLYRYDNYANYSLAAYFMYKQEQTPYHFSLVALDCGLGKTLTTLIFIGVSRSTRKILIYGQTLGQRWLSVPLEPLMSGIRILRSFSQAILSRSTSSMAQRGRSRAAEQATSSATLTN